MKQHIQAIRSFNRFYTRHLGLLNDRLLDSNYSLAEARILFEIGTRQPIRMSELSELLGIDKGYLSRVITGFVKSGVVLRRTSKDDKRSSNLSLTKKGEQKLASLQLQSDQQVAGFTSRLSREELESMVNSMNEISLMLDEGYDKKKLAAAVTYRDKLQPGDLGYMTYMHGKYYAQDEGYSMEFEGYVAKTFFEFVGRYDEKNDKVWLAEYQGEIVASIAILRRSQKEAQLRWFLVNPMFRGTGVGSRLFDMALSYCRSRFKSVYLMTADTQQQAIAMYKRAGFTLTSSVDTNQWGMRLKEERYDLIIS
ncbi:helix-turn-helix domain-containing GNAT family N-acetyltransferase [Chryseolinea sp. T2]|uniref:bifunctional helix-turn-helix transcriptional regulator/GNAT family N-acetyltransferase n=1 Tax=Chryseolinea sp. T2 TaxID=3129255 RepID=UPI003078524B